MGKLFDEHCGGYGKGVDVGNVLRRTLQTLRVHQVSRAGPWARGAQHRRRTVWGPLHSGHAMLNAKCGVQVRIDVNYATLVLNVLCLDGVAGGCFRERIPVSFCVCVCLGVCLCAPVSLCLCDSASACLCLCMGLCLCPSLHLCFM